MIDHIASLETTISNMATGVWPMKKTEQIQPAQAAAVSESQVRMDLETLKVDYPEIVAVIMQEGADAERARIQGCEDACLPGHEALVASMKFDGKSTGADVAMAIIQEEEKIRANHLQDFRTNAPKPVPHAATPAVDNGEAPNSSLPLEDRCKAEWESSESIRNEFKTFGAFLSYKKVEEKNKSR
jgi:hypothetical protein